MNENTDKYKDIINLPHHVSTERKHMSLYDRAAQFAPFAALTGFEDDVEEKERLTDEKIEIAEDELIRMNERFMMFLSQIGDDPTVSIEVFKADDKKDGGSTVKVTGKIRRFDETERKLYFDDGRVVSLSDIVKIDNAFDSDF